jgi:murein DD-endopeptidase MepM/ murein hydrolase activator NlpD
VRWPILLLALLATGCTVSARTRVAAPGAPRPPAAEMDDERPAPAAALDELRFPVTDGAWAACSRGFAPAERHFGLDIPAPTGTPVVASAGGEVVRAAPHAHYGLVVVVRHAGHRYTLYAHLSALAVAAGEAVAAGATLGEVGRTGNATGPHLHWEVLRAAGPLPVRAEGPLGIAGGDLRVDPAEEVAELHPSCRPMMLIAR